MAQSVPAMAAARSSCKILLARLLNLAEFYPLSRKTRLTFEKLEARITCKKVFRCDLDQVMTSTPGVRLHASQFATLLKGHVLGQDS